MRLFYSIAAIAWAASCCFGTPPPGYVKKPSTDKDPPAYEYKYEIGDGTGKGQGKAETRAGEFASGSYYVNTGDGATDVKYFADDWGYHPVVKYGTSFKHGSTTTRFALGEHAVKALRSGDVIGRKVKLPSDDGRRKSVQIIQPYTVEGSDPASVTPTYPTSTATTPKDEELVRDSGESSSDVEELGKESRVPSTTLIPPSSHSTTPEAVATYTPDEIAAATPTQLAFTPLQELRNIYANNDYRNAALIDEQLYLQNSGSFGNKVQSLSSGESGLRVGDPTSTTTRRPYPLTKQNGDVTYTVHSSSNSNSAYLSATGKRLQSWREISSTSSTTSSTTESAAIFSSTSSEFTRNDLAGEYPATDPRLVNYALADAGLKETYHSETGENQELATASSGARKTFGTFAKPIVVAELGPEYGATCKCNDETTPTPVSTYSIRTTTLEPTATPKAQSQNRETTSSVILNPIQAGVALVHAGEAHLISNHEESRSQNFVSTSFQDESEKSRAEEERKQLEDTVARIAEEIQLQKVQEVQQELELQRGDYASQEVLVREEKQREEERREDYRYKNLEEETRLRQEVELQQVEESQHNEQLEVQAIGQLGVEGSEAIVVHKIENSNEEEGRLGSLGEGSFGTEEIRQAIEEREKQDLEKYHEAYSGSSRDSESVGSGGGDEDKIEIQKSIEIYHNTPVQEIHYPSSGRVAIEVGSIEEGSEVGKEYVDEVRSVDNTRGSYRGQELESGLGVSLEFNQATGLREKDQFSLSAENEAQQVLLGGYPGPDQVLVDLPRSNSLPQKILLEESSSGQYDYQKPAEEEQPRVPIGIDHQTVQLQRVVLPENDGRGYQLNQREQSQSHSYSQADSYSYESNRVQQQQQQQQQQQVGAAGLLPYTLEASQELILPGISSGSVHQAVNPGSFNNYATFSVSEYFPIPSGEIGFQQQQHHHQQLGGNQVVEKTVHIPAPYPVETVVEKTVPLPVSVEKVVEKQVPYPIERIVEKRIPIPQPYPVHIKVPHPYPVETIVEKPVKVHVPVPVTKLVEKKVPVPQPYPVEVEKIVEKKVPYPVEVIKYVDKPYPVERIVDRPIQIRVPYAVEVPRNVPYGVRYGVSYQQIMRPHSHSLYINHGGLRQPLYGLPVASRYQDFRQQGDSKQQLQGYSYENPGGAKFVEGNGGDQISSGNQQVQFKHFGASSIHQQQSSPCDKKFNPHLQLQIPHFSGRRHVPRSSQDGSRNEEYIGPVPPQRSPIGRHHQVQQRIIPQQSTIATRSPDPTTTFRRTREPEAKPQSSPGTFRQSRVEYGFKPPMKPSIQYDEETASKVES